VYGKYAYAMTKKAKKAKELEAIRIGGAEEREYCKSFLLIHQTGKNERTAQS